MAVFNKAIQYSICKTVEVHTFESLVVELKSPFKTKTNIINTTANATKIKYHSIVQQLNNLGASAN